MLIHRKQSLTSLCEEAAFWFRWNYWVVTLVVLVIAVTGIQPSTLFASALQTPTKTEQPADGKDAASDEADQQESESTEDTQSKSQDKKMEASNETAGSNPESANTSVEEERPIEVDPPQAPQTESPKQPDQSKDTQEATKQKCVIGSTAVLLEKQSELKFRARVDTGAKSCSMHVEEIKIEDESTKTNEQERMTENIGKVIHFQVKNGDNKTHILSSKIAGYVIIKTSNKKEGSRRYKVPLTFLWKNVEKEVLVTLNDRGHMEYPLLLGRNFLRGDFLVDVELDSDD